MTALDSLHESLQYKDLCVVPRLKSSTCLVKESYLFHILVPVDFSVVSLS
jgi:hypothetical protein